MPLDPASVLATLDAAQTALEPLAEYVDGGRARLPADLVITNNAFANVNGITVAECYAAAFVCGEIDKLQNEISRAEPTTPDALRDELRDTLAEIVAAIRALQIKELVARDERALLHKADELIAKAQAAGSDDRLSIKCVVCGEPAVGRCEKTEGFHRIAGKTS